MRACAFLVLCLVSACDCFDGGDSGGGDGAAAPAPPVNVTTTTAQGVVVQVNPILIVDDLANAPAGARPIGGVSIRVFDLVDRLVAEAVSGPNGTFDIPDLPSGLLRAEVRVDAAADPDVTVEFTSVPRTTIPLGRDYPVDRAAAAALALAGVPADALVVGTLQPLPAGTVVEPAGLPVVEDDAAPEPDSTTVLANDTWLFFVDLFPDALFAHACELVFVDAESGAVTRTGVDFWPVVNGAHLWGGAAHYHGTDGQATSEVLQEPPPLAAEPLRDLGRSLAATGVDDVFVIQLVGYQNDPGFQKDVVSVQEFYMDLGVPLSQRYFIAAEKVVGEVEEDVVVEPVLEQETLDFVKAELSSAFAAAREFCKRRRDAGGEPTVILHLNSHGGSFRAREGGSTDTRKFGVVGLNTRPPPDPDLVHHTDLIVASAFCFNRDGVNGYVEAEEDTYVKDESFDVEVDEGTVTIRRRKIIRVIGLDELGLGTLCACRVRIIVDSCFSVLHICDIEKKVDFGPPDERPDVRLVGSAEGKARQDFFGAVFTKALLERVTLEDGDLVGYLRSDETDLLESLRVMGSGELRQVADYKRIEGADCAAQTLGVEDLFQRIEDVTCVNPLLRTIFEKGVSGENITAQQAGGSVVTVAGEVDRAMLNVDTGAVLFAPLAFSPGQYSALPFGIPDPANPGSFANIGLAMAGPTGFTIEYFDAVTGVRGGRLVSAFVENVTDVFPVGKDQTNGHLVYCNLTRNEIVLLEPDQFNELTATKVIQPSQYPGASGGAISAIQKVPNGPVLFVTDGTPGELWKLDDPCDPLSMAVKVGNVGDSPRRIRYCDDVVTVTNFGDGTVTTARWTDTECAIVETVAVGDSPIGVDLMRQPGGNIAVATTGFHDDTYRISVVRPDATVAHAGTSTALPPECEGPGFVTFLEDGRIVISVSLSAKLVVLTPTIPG